MCGLAFVLRKDGRQARKQLEKTYEKQKTRGQQGFGYVSFSNGILENYARTETQAEIYKSLRSVESTGIMFHHRFPTSTPNYAEGAHPIFVSNSRLKYDYYVIHNGVIRNADELKKKHEAKGYIYTTQMFKKSMWETRDKVYQELYMTIKFNDSEAFAIELAEGIEAESEKIEAYGSIAFICIQTNKNDNVHPVQINKIYFGRNTNPLKLEANNNFIKLSSEGDGEEIDAHKLFEFDPKDNVIMESKCVFGTDYVVPTYPTKPTTQRDFRLYRWDNQKQDFVLRTKEELAQYDEDFKPKNKQIGFVPKDEDSELGVKYLFGRKDIDDFVKNRKGGRIADIPESRREEIEEMLDSQTPEEIEDEYKYLSGDEEWWELEIMLVGAERQWDRETAKGQMARADKTYALICEIEDAMTDLQEEAINEATITEVESIRSLRDGLKEDI